MFGGRPVQLLEWLRYPRHDMTEVSIVYPRDDRALITIERPRTLNSLDIATLNALEGAAREVAEPVVDQGCGRSGKGPGVFVGGRPGVCSGVGMAPTRGRWVRRAAP